MLLDSVARLVTDGPAAAAPVLRQLVDSFVPGDLSGDEGLRWGRVAAVLLWDDDAGQTIMDRNIRQARAAGALEHLPLFLDPLAMSAGWRGDFAAAASLTAEGDSIAEATGVSIAPYAAMFVAALRGNQAELTRLIETTIAEAEAGGQGAAVTSAHRALAILHNGLGRYADALAAAERTTQDANVYVSMWALPS